MKMMKILVVEEVERIRYLMILPNVRYYHYSGCCNIFFHLVKHLWSKTWDQSRGTMSLRLVESANFPTVVEVIVELFERLFTGESLYCNYLEFLKWSLLINIIPCVKNKPFCIFENIGMYKAIVQRLNFLGNKITWNLLPFYLDTFHSFIWPSNFG